MVRAEQRRFDSDLGPHPSHPGPTIRQERAEEWRAAGRGRAGPGPWVVGADFLRESVLRRRPAFETGVICRGPALRPAT